MQKILCVLSGLGKPDPYSRVPHLLIHVIGSMSIWYEDFDLYYDPIMTLSDM
jgi:hypothetical protein